MRIQEKDGDLVDIYAIYWVNNKTLLLGFPRNYGGLLSYDLSEVNIIEPNIDYQTSYFHNRAYGIYHWALIKEKLLDDLLELDETAYKRFLEILKTEGHIDQDFF